MVPTRGHSGGCRWLQLRRLCIPCLRRPPVETSSKDSAIIIPTSDKLFLFLRKCLKGAVDRSGDRQTDLAHKMCVRRPRYSSNMYLVVPPGLKCKHIAFRLVTVGAQNLLRFFPDALSRKNTTTDT